MTAGEDIDWATIRRLYESGSPGVAAICAAAGIGTGALYRRARKENWQRRRDDKTGAKRRGRRTAKPRRKGEAAPEAPRKVDRSGLIRRLYAALERQVREVEARLAAEDGPASAGERDARTLSNLARTFEKLMEIDGGGAEAHDEGGARDIDALRKELAKRIDRLRRERGDR